MFNVDIASGFIFDCDGTLLDSLQAWEVAEHDLFAQAGDLTQAQQDEIHSAPIEKAAEIFHERYGVGQSAQDVLNHLDSHLLSFYGSQALPMPGAVEFVQAVHDAGIPCVVLSSSPRRYLQAGLQRAGILSCFKELVTTDEVGCSKREFKIYEHALNVLGSQKERTWAVDDAPYALEVMRSFGINTIGVANGCSQEHEQQVRKHSALFVRTLEELC